MLVRIYKSGYIIHAASLVIIAIIIWLPTLLSPEAVLVVDNPAPLYELFLSVLGINYLVNLFISLLLVVISGIILNQIIINNEFSGKITMLGMFFFILLNTSIVSYVIMNPFLWVSFFLILMINELFKLSKSEKSIPLVFNASFYLGIASLFYYPSFLLIIVVLVSLMIFRISSWREYLIVLIGTSLPLFFTFILYFYNDSQDLFISSFISAFYFDFNISSISVMDLIIAVLLLGLIIPSVLNLVGSMMDNSIIVRQKLAVIIWLLVISFAIIFLFEKHVNNGLMLSVPATIILTKFSMGVRRLKWLDIYISLIFVLILINHYLVLFDA